MSSLLIIGNGFDLHHKMKTKYWDYREFLLKNGKGDIVEAFEQRDESNKKYLWNELERQIKLTPFWNISRVNPYQLRQLALKEVERNK